MAAAPRRAEAPTAVVSWAGNVRHAGRTVLRPASREELQDILRANPGTKFAAIATCHSQRLPDAPAYISTLSLDRILSLDRGAQCVTVEAGVTQKQLLRFLHSHGFTIHVSTGIHDQTLVGAVCTDSHGLGRHHTQLLCGVLAARLFDWAGQSHVFTHTETNWCHSLSALPSEGIIYEMTYKVEPLFWMRAVMVPRPASALSHCLADPERLRLMVTILPSIPGIFTLHHRPCPPPRWYHRVVNGAYSVFKCYFAELALAIRNYQLLARLMSWLGPRLPSISVQSTNTDIVATARYMAGVGDIEFALPIRDALRSFAAIRRVLDAQPILMYNLRFGKETSFPSSMTYQQDTMYVSVQFLYHDMNLKMLDHVSRALRCRVHRGKYQPAP